MKLAIKFAVKFCQQKWFYLSFLLCIHYLLVTFIGNYRLLKIMDAEISKKYNNLNHKYGLLYENTWNNKE